MADALRGEIKEAIVRSLRLPMKPEEIGNDMPLFGEGLGLDSIDVLERLPIRTRARKCCARSIRSPST